MSKNKQSKKSQQPKKNESEVYVDGIVIEALPNAMFRVELANSQVVLCTICGKMRSKARQIRIVPDDKVLVGVSIYDMTRGRIHFRYK